MVMALTAAACGGSAAPSSTAFVGAVDDICHTLDRTLIALDEPTALAGVATYADKASRAYETSLVALKKLPIPADKNVVADGKDLVANMDEQVTLLDDISTAATAGDQTKVTAKTAQLDKLMTDTSKIATSLGAARCAIDPLLVAMATPPSTTSTTSTTVAPTTVPDTTTPLTLVPPTTAPSITTATTSANSDTEKKILPLASAMSKNAKYTYVDAPNSITQNFLTVLNVVPETANAPGKVGGVEVSDKSGTKFARVFIFMPTDPLGTDTMKSITRTLVGSDTSKVATYGTLKGTVYHSSGNGYFFIAGNPLGAPQVVLWAVAQDTTGLKTAVEAFLSNVPA
jgi:hypothetical protein